MLSDFLNCMNSWIYWNMPSMVCSYDVIYCYFSTCGFSASLHVVIWHLDKRYLFKKRFFHCWCLWNIYSLVFILGSLRDDVFSCWGTGKYQPDMEWNNVEYTDGDLTSLLFYVGMHYQTCFIVHVVVWFSFCRSIIYWSLNLGGIDAPRESGRDGRYQAGKTAPARSRTVGN